VAGEAPVAALAAGATAAVGDAAPAGVVGTRGATVGAVVAALVFTVAVGAVAVLPHAASRALPAAALVAARNRRRVQIVIALTPFAGRQSAVVG